MASINLFGNLYILRYGMVFGKKGPVKKLIEASVEREMLTTPSHIPSMDNVLVTRLQELYGGDIKLDKRPEFKEGVTY